MIEDLTKDLLEKEYVQNGKYMYQIAAEYEVAVGTVFNRMKQYGVPSRKAMTDEVRKRISDKLKGKPSSMKGKKHTDEAKRKMSAHRKGKYIKHSEFGGHIKTRCDGYKAVYVPDHPHATKEGYVMEHILVMEKSIGRLLEKDEVVHHKNHNRADNRIENLQLMTFKEHAGLHMKERWMQKKGMMTY